MRHLLIFMLLLLTGCGFHLRGAVQLPTGLSEIAVKDANTDIAPDLRRAIRSAGILVTDSASMVLQLRTEKYDKRVLSVDTLGRAQEYGLSYTVRFSLKDEGEGKSGTTWIAEVPVTQTRDLRFDANAVLGSGNEETELNIEMRRDAVSQILRQLQYAKEPMKQIDKSAEQPVKESESK
jgi:LPS-assembly lipoprotein